MCRQKCINRFTLDRCCSQHKSLRKTQQTQNVAELRTRRYVPATTVDFPGSLNSFPDFRLLCIAFAFSSIPSDLYVSAMSTCADTSASTVSLSTGVASISRNARFASSRLRRLRAAPRTDIHVTRDGRGKSGSDSICSICCIASSKRPCRQNASTRQLKC